MGGSLSESYRIFETRRFQKDIEDLAGNIEFLQTKLKKYVYPQLRQEPHFGLNVKRLKGFVPAVLRYRIADWRFFYSVDEKQKIVFMLSVSHRKDAYR
ncbi:MAG: type II toxin-antitoxin system RelE/ParE family toxin [Deltaproteobacteria bacterium]|nr:type II toxin-antitoxin system RelE/ParE family toxin [Deltaproteobacteria bacterium]